MIEPEISDDLPKNQPKDETKNPANPPLNLLITGKYDLIMQSRSWGINLPSRYILTQSGCDSEYYFVRECMICYETNNLIIANSNFFLNSHLIRSRYVLCHEHSDCLELLESYRLVLYLQLPIDLSFSDRLINSKYGVANLLAIFWVQNRGEFYVQLKLVNKANKFFYQSLASVLLANNNFKTEVLFKCKWPDNYPQYLRQFFSQELLAL